MIFITTGSREFPFDRLLKSIDVQKSKGLIEDELFAQLGVSNYIPKSYKYKKYLDREEFEKYLDEADIVITHGGTGIIVNALKKGKRIIAVPRLASFKEHIDNHQIEIVGELGNKGFIESCYNLDDLADIIKKIRHKEIEPYKSNSHIFLKNIKEDIDSMLQGRKR